MTIRIYSQSQFFLAFGLLYPLGMVLGLAKNRWHVPVQILASAIFVVGLFLAHAHNGRNYVNTKAIDSMNFFLFTPIN